MVQPSYEVTHLVVLHDRAGKVLAAAPHVRVKAGERAPFPRPVAKRGQFVSEVSIPREFQRVPLHEACQQLVVDMSGERPMLIERRTRSSRNEKRAKKR
jgi:hypothetical protein